VELSASGLFCDEADVVELLSESEIVDIDMDDDSEELAAALGPRDLPSVEVIVDEDPSVPAIAASGPVPTSDMFADDDPTVRLGTLPPAPFPRHLAPSGSVPPPATSSLRSALVPREFLPTGVSRSLPPISLHSTHVLAARREPTMKIRGQVSVDEPSVVIVRGRPNVLWGAALVAAGVIGGIVCSQLLVTPADDVVHNAPATTAAVLASPAPAAPAAPEAVHETAGAIATPNAPNASHAHDLRGAHVEPTSAAPIEAPKRAAMKPAAVAAAPAAATGAPQATTAAAPAAKTPQAPQAPQAPASAQASLAKKPPPVAAVTPPAPAAPSVKGKTALPANDLANDQAADALARAQLKAALR
jgi:hypothetical protein